MVELVAEAQETSTDSAEGGQPSPEDETIAAVSEDDTAAAGTEEVAFDGGALTAEALDETAKSAAEEQPADVPLEAVAESEVSTESAPAESAVAEPAEPVLAADAIAASAAASQELAERERAEDAEPVVVDRELTWGFIDTEGRVHQQTTEHFRGRPIGKIHGGSGELQIAEYESNFGPLLKEVELLESDVSTSKNKVSVLTRVRKTRASAGRAEALGDFDALFARLAALEATIQQEVDERRAAKEALINRAEAMKDSTEWKVTGEAYKELFQEWKQVGSTGREADDALWARFIGARERFNTRRSEHFNQRQEQWEANRLLKQDLSCARMSSAFPINGGPPVTRSAACSTNGRRSAAPAVSRTKSSGNNSGERSNTSTTERDAVR